MPATSSPDCMAVCVPAEQNETFTVSEDVVSVDEDGTDIVSERECLLTSTLKNGRISHLSALPEVEFTHTMLATSRTVGLLPPIPESEHGDGWETFEAPKEKEKEDDHTDEPRGKKVFIVTHDHHDDDEDEDFPVPSFTRIVHEHDDADFEGHHDNETAQLFRDLLHLNRAGEHVAFSGADSHQYLFQHFDTDALEYEEAAAVRPKFIGQYLLGDCLGEGSYAKVKEALNTETLERTAIKIFSPVKLKRIPNGMQNVLKEVNILRKLDHPNVCRMRELLKKELKKKLYLIMDFAVCAISDLTKTLPQERLPAWKAHYYFVQLLDGLQYCHSKGVIHKDLKPSNLVVTTQDTLKIIDFGVAEQLSPYAANDLIFSSQGCPAVQPPEVADGLESFSGFKLDVWSCGVTFFSLCAGNSKFPFVGETVYELFANISEHPHEMPKEIKDTDPEFCNLIDLMLEKKETNRPSLDAIRHHPWIRRHWPMPPAGIPVQETIDKAAIRSVDSFLPYIKAYYHSSTRTSRAGSICCTTGGRVQHHHHHYPRCHSHHLVPHNTTWKSCRHSHDRRRASIESRLLTHNNSIRSIHRYRDTSNHHTPAVEEHSVGAVMLDRSESAEQGCFSVKKWKLCRVT